MIELFKKVISLLNSAQKKSFIILFVLMLIGMVLETLGIGLIIPLFSLITDQNFVDKYQTLTIFLTKLYPTNWFLNFSELKPEQNELVIVAVTLVVLIYFFKGAFLIYLSWRQTTFLKGTNKYWASKLFLGYLKLPYSFHTQKNSSNLFNNILHTNTLVNVIDSFTVLLAEALVIFGISVLLMVTRPVEALLIITLLAFSSYIVHFFTKKHLMEWGKQRHFHDGKTIKHLRQGFGAVKELKILGSEKNFSEIFDFHLDASLRVARNSSVIHSLKRSWLELTIVFAMSVLLLIMMTQYTSYVNIIPTLGLFAAAAFRLMPSASRILFSAHNIRLNVSVLNILFDEFTKTIENKTYPDQKKTLSFDKILEVEKIHFTYQDRNESVLSNINLKIQNGSQVGFIGESGSGKSTLVDVIIGLLNPSKGIVKVDGDNIQYGLRSWLTQIGYVPQSIYLTDDTIRNNVAFALKNDKINDQAVKDAIKAADLEEFIYSLPEGLNTIVGEKGVRISGGQRQRIGIARALYQRPTVLIFDEATSALDVETEKDIMNSINKFKGKKTVIIVSHRLSAVSNCDQLFKLDKGKITNVR